MKSLASLTFEQGQFFKEEYAARLIAARPNDPKREGAPSETTNTAMSSAHDFEQQGIDAQDLLRAARKRQTE